MEMDGPWVTLDERMKAADLQKPGAHFIEFVGAEGFYCEFRILQTGPSSSNYLSFNLSAFEIHGWVKRR
jgi:hypothetical protein